MHRLSPARVQTARSTPSEKAVADPARLLVFDLESGSQARRARSGVRWIAFGSGRQEGGHNGIRVWSPAARSAAAFGVLARVMGAMAWICWGVYVGYRSSGSGSRMRSERDRACGE